MRNAGKSEGTGQERQAIEGARISVCASDETIAARIEDSLTLAGHQIVAVSSSLEGLVSAASPKSPQLVVLVTSFGPFAATAEARLVRTALGDIPFVVVATGPIGRGARKLVLSQVDGLLDESELETALVATVNCALADQLCVPAGLRERLAQPVFSYREKQVLELVLAGLTNGEIAGRLYLSESTVKSHLASSFRKLGVSSRVEAARRVLDPDSGLDLSLQPLGEVPAPVPAAEFV
jgi:DNA-binding NarL/FixJ family response regulator